jgi:hypothetical protein
MLYNWNWIHVELLDLTRLDQADPFFLRVDQAYPIGSLLVLIVSTIVCRCFVDMVQDGVPLHATFCFLNDLLCVK